MEYLHLNKKTTHAKESKQKMENRKINAETNLHGNKLSTQMLFTNSFARDNNQLSRQPLLLSKSRNYKTI